MGTIAIGLLLPTVSPCVVFLAADFAKVPALYWRGMDADGHSLYPQVSCLIGAWYLIIALLGALYILFQVLCDPPRNTSKQLATSLHDLWSCISPYIGRSVKTLLGLGIFLIILFAITDIQWILSAAISTFLNPGLRLVRVLFPSSCTFHERLLRHQSISHVRVRSCAVPLLHALCPTVGFGLRSSFCSSGRSSYVFWR